VQRHAKEEQKETKKLVDCVHAKLTPSWRPWCQWSGEGSPRRRQWARGSDCGHGPFPRNRGEWRRGYKGSADGWRLRWRMTLCRAAGLRRDRCLVQYKFRATSLASVTPSDVANGIADEAAFLLDTGGTAPT
jgi:hypothetical protein